MTTGSLVVLVGMMLVSNRSNRRERLLNIFVISGSLIYSTLRRRGSSSLRSLSMILIVSFVGRVISPRC